jgi:hypothetical protein
MKEVRGSFNFLNRPTYGGSGLALQAQSVGNANWGQNGFANTTDSTIDFNSSTRIFQIAATGSAFSYFVDGVEHSTSGAHITLAATEGVHYIYFDGSSLTAAANPSTSQIDTVIRTKAIVAAVYWSTVNTSGIFVGDERHGKGMSPNTHAYLHFTEGLRYLSGLGLNNMTVDGDGSLAVHAQFGIDSGSVTDEDLWKAISAVASGTGLPLYHMEGASASPNWVITEPSGYSVKPTGTGRLAYNQLTGGSWQLTEIGNNNFVLAHVFATTEKDRPMLALMGQNEYSNIAQARDGAAAEVLSLVTSDILFPEIKPIATVIYQTSNGYTNPVKARVRTTDDGDNYVDWRSEVVSRVELTTSIHNNLAGLQGGAAGERYHLTSAEHATLTNVTVQAATSGTYAVDWSLGGLTRITLDGNITFTFSNPYDGQKHIIQIKQDTAASHTATWPATVRWPGGTAPTLTATSGGIDYIGFIYDGTDGKYDGIANSLNMG